MTTPAALAARIAAAGPGVGPVRLVCIDGPAGSGKTTFAAALVDALATRGREILGAGAAGVVPLTGAVPLTGVVHGDEIYEGWPVVAGCLDRVQAFSELAERVETWLFEPWRRGAVALQPVWSWPGGRWGEPVAVPASPVVILDGVGLASRRLRERAALTIWVEADSAVRLERVLARDGEALRAEMTTWQRDEHQWFALDATREACDVHVTGTAQGASPDVR